MTRPEELDARGRRLRAALAAVIVRDRARELDLVHQWLDTWAGLGLVVAGMTHQGWDVQLTAYAARDWRATFYPVGITHSIVGGTAWEPTPRQAVQRGGVGDAEARRMMLSRVLVLFALYVAFVWYLWRETPAT